MAISYSLLFNIVCNTQATLDGVLAQLPLLADSKVKADISREGKQTLSDKGDKVVSGEIFFPVEADRASIVTKLGDVDALLAKCVKGTSSIKLLDSTHYKDGRHIKADAPCETTKEWSN